MSDNKELKRALINNGLIKPVDDVKVDENKKNDPVVASTKTQRIQSALNSVSTESASISDVDAKLSYLKVIESRRI